MVPSGPLPAAPRTARAMILVARSSSPSAAQPRSPVSAWRGRMFLVARRVQSALLRGSLLSLASP